MAENTAHDIEEADFLTLKNIVFFIKRSFLRIVIYTTAALILAGAVSAGIYAFTKSRGSAAALLQYSYPGAESGLDPFGQTLDVNFIRSDYIIERVLKRTGMNIGSAEISGALSITPVVPAYILEKYNTINRLSENDPQRLSLLESIRFYPSQFSVELKLPFLKADEAAVLLNEIITEYKLYFAEVFYSLNIFDSSTISPDSLQKYDYTDIAEIYENRLIQFDLYLSRLIQNSKDYKSGTTGLSISELRMRALLLKNYGLKTAGDFISVNCVTKYTYGEYKKLRNEKIFVLESEKAVFTATAKSIKEILADFENTHAVILPSSDGGQPVEVIAPSAQYDTLLNELIRAETEIAKTSEKINLTAYALEKIALKHEDDKSGNADIEYITALFESINTEFNGLALKAAETVKEFYEKEYMPSAVSAVIPPVTFADKLNASNALFVFAIAAVTALTAALTETAVRLNKEKKQKLKNTDTVSAQG